MKRLILSLLGLALCCSSAHAGLFRSRGGCSSCANGQCSRPENTTASATAKPAADIKAPAPFTVPVYLENPTETPQAKLVSIEPKGDFLEAWIQNSNGQWYRLKFLRNDIR